MLFKEKGYDEFLAEQIKLGKNAVAKGEVFTKEQINSEMNQLFLEMRKNQELRDNEQAFGVSYA